MSLSQRIISLLVVSTFLIAGLAEAQVPITGQVSGTVPVDTSGAALPAATVTAHDPSTDITKSVTANAAGQYVFPVSAAGNYQLTATAQGFATAIYKGVVVNRGAQGIDHPMKVGTATERVEVTAQGVEFETTTNTLATTIDPDEIQNLPLLGATFAYG